MNPAPDQPPATTIPSAPSIGSIPNPVIPVSSMPITDQPPPSNNIQPPTDIPPPHHRFPFMMVTLFLVIILAGFAGSFLFLSNTSKHSQKIQVQIKITPPIAIPSSATPETNPFATSSSDLVNPFASPTASLVNPFGTYQNPFSGSENATANQTYQNPFENLK